MRLVKIFRAAEWEALQQQGRFLGSPDDLRDGFIHLSTEEELQGTLLKHFAGEEGLVIATVELAADDPALRFEPSRGGTLFPHLYRPLRREECLLQRGA